MTFHPFSKPKFSLGTLIVAIGGSACAFAFVRFMVQASDWQRALTIFGGFGIGLLTTAIYSEVWWRRRLSRWEETAGTVAGLIEVGDDSHPEIEFQFDDGSAKRFVSKFARPQARVGESVRVVYDPETGEAEQYTFSNRWFITLGCGLLGSLFAYVAVMIFTGEAIIGPPGD